MIPKTIHYVWLSGDAKPARIESCIDSWRRVMPDYEIVEWDMERVRREVPMILWLEQSIVTRLWAFATDYLRFWILHRHGGIYLDSDVRVVAPFDRFLHHGAFTAIEMVKERKGPDRIGVEAAILGSRKGHPLFQRFLDYYHNRPFFHKNMFDLIPLPLIMNQVLLPAGFRTGQDGHQVLEEDFQIYPGDVFANQSGHGVGEYYLSENTAAIHLVSGSWWYAQEEWIKLAGFVPKWWIYTKQYWINIWRDVIVLSVRGRTAQEKSRSR